MNKKTFSDGVVLRFGWKKMQEHLGFLFVSFLIMFGASITPIILSIFVPGKYWYIALALYIGYFVLSVIMGIGLVQIILDITDGKRPSFATLFTRWDVFFKYIAVTILYGIVALGGFILFIIPGCIWMLMFWFAPILVVDKKMGPIEAMKKSAQMTKGLKWDLLGFYYTTMIINSLGMLCFYVGLIITAPTTLIAMTKTYRKLL